MSLRVSLTLISLWFSALVFGQGGGQFYGDYRTVKTLAFSEDGRLWAGTRGGLMLVGSSAKTFGWDGLIEGRGLDDLWSEGRTLYGSAGDLVATWGGSRWIPTTRSPRIPEEVAWSENRYRVPGRATWPSIEGPLSPPLGNKGSHVTAVATNGTTTVAAWYGDGLWSHDGLGWTRLEEAFPFVRSVAMAGNHLAIATFEGSIWLRTGTKWKQVKSAQGLQGSVYSMTSMGSNVLAGTFEHGLYRFDGRWSPLSSRLEHPREMAVFRERLYVRHTTGRVDRYDGKRWATNVFPWLLRREATSLSTGADRLLVGQFGGWSEFDGTRWSHFLKVPDLQGVVVTSVAAEGPNRWIGTQGRGLFHLNQGNIFDQRTGLSDDWVRRILVDRRSVIVGMFLGGAFAKRDKEFVRLTPEVAGEATALVRAPNGKLLIGTREGLWRDGTRVPISGVHLEIQAMLGTTQGVWLGLPNGTAFVPWSRLS